MTLAIDASLAVRASIAAGGFDALADQTLVAPALMWSEAHSVLHEHQWRGDLTPEQALAACTVLAQAPIAKVDDPRIQREAWRAHQTVSLFAPERTTPPSTDNDTIS